MLLRVKSPNSAPNRKVSFEKQIEEAFTRYEKGLRQCQTALEVQQHAGSETGKLFELIEAVGREEDERRYIARVRNTTNSRRTEISAEIEALENKIREEQMDSLRQLNALRETLKLELMGMQSVLDVSSLKSIAPWFGSI